MINDNTDPRPKMIRDMTPLERRIYFSSAKSELVMPDTPVRRLPLRRRRNSVRHRSIR